MHRVFFIVMRNEKNIKRYSLPEQSNFTGMAQYSVRKNKADTSGIISSVYGLSLQGCPSRGPATVTPEARPRYMKKQAYIIHLEARGNSYFPQLINAAWFVCQVILLSSATYGEMFRIINKWFDYKILR